MKKTLLLGLLLAAGLNAFAQAPGDGLSLVNGSIAPDFTARDINGNLHSLYADYLDQGKSVIIDFSATWCAPCWAYHQTHAMAEIYDAYGPNGSNEVMVIFVEGDVPNTTLANIYGEQGPIAPSQGNWTIGSPYPIIEDTEQLRLGAPDMYDVDYFPTMYMICANTKKTTRADQKTREQLRTMINNGCQPLTGIANHGKLTRTSDRLIVCENGGTTNAQAQLRNYGNNAITSATIVIKKDGAVVATKNYTGNLAQFAAPVMIDFEDVALTAGTGYTYEVTSINGSTVANPQLVVDTFDVIVGQQASNNIVVNVYTDNYPGEASWKIKDSDGTVVASFGPYQAGPAADHSGGPDANTTKRHNIVLPEGIDCYSVELLDSFGDGWGLGTTAHGIEIFTAEGSKYNKFVSDFGYSTEDASAFQTTGTLSTGTFQSTTFNIYPNPSTGIFNITTPENVDITVLDIAGKVVYTAKGIVDGDSINLNSLQKGVYVAKINGATSQRTEKIVIK
jgi:thiol-disulfide isomerase/thioredoxin